MKRHFDAVVVGGGLSAMLSASLLAKRRFTTLLVDQGELSRDEGSPLGSYVRTGEHSAVVQQVHRELGLQDEIRRGLLPPDSALQVVFPDLRFDLPPQRARLLSEVQRRLRQEEGRLPGLLQVMDRANDEVAVFLEAAKELPATGFFAKRSHQQQLRKHAEVFRPVTDEAAFAGGTSHLTEVMLSVLPFASHLDCRRPEQATLARLGRLVVPLLAGFRRLRAHDGPRAFLASAMEGRGLKIERAAVEHVRLKGKTVQLGLTSDRAELSCSAFIDASSDLSGLDSIETKKKELAVMMQAAKPRGFLHTLVVDIDRGVLPPPLAREVLLLNGRRDRTREDQRDPDGEDRPIWLSVRDLDGQRVRLRASHPISTARAHAQKFDTLNMIIRARLRRLIPFFEEGAPNYPAQTDETPHPFFGLDHDDPTGISGVSTRTPFKNVFAAGPAVLPGLGVEGKYRGAVQAADAVAKLLKKNAN